MRATSRRSRPSSAPRRGSEVKPKPTTEYVAVLLCLGAFTAFGWDGGMSSTGRVVTPEPIPVVEWHSGDIGRSESVLSVYCDEDAGSAYTCLPIRVRVHSTSIQIVKPDGGVCR